jgi:adenylate cyclase
MSTAGSQPIEVVARGVSALQPTRRSLVRELGLAGPQVWQSLSEATGRGHGELEMAILFADLVGFTGWALKAGDTAALELLRRVGTGVETAVTEYDGARQ